MQYTNIIFFALALSLITCAVYGTTVRVTLESSDIYTDNEVYFLDATFNLTLTEESLDALRHGIPLEIHTSCQLRMIRDWLWDKKVEETQQTYRLEHQPLTEDYLTINLKTGLRQFYNNLDAALKNINTISKLPLFNKATIEDEHRYIVRIKTYLNINSLPSPMRTQIYFSDEWNISSSWHEIEIN